MNFDFAGVRAAVCKDAADCQALAAKNPGTEAREYADPVSGEPVWVYFGSGPAGGNQGSPDKILGIFDKYTNYNVNSSNLLDVIKTNLAEHFGGAHDFMNDPIYYDEAGNNRYLPGDPRDPSDWYNLLNIVRAAPYAAGSMTDPWLYRQIKDSEE